MHYQAQTGIKFELLSVFISQQVGANRTFIGSPNTSAINPFAIYFKTGSKTDSKNTQITMQKISGSDWLQIYLFKILGICLFQL